MLNLQPVTSIYIGLFLFLGVTRIEAADLSFIKKGDRTHLVLGISAASPTGNGQAECDAKIVNRFSDHLSLQLLETVPACGNKHELHSLSLDRIGAVERRQASNMRRAGTVLVTTAAVLGLWVTGIGAASAAIGGSPGVAALLGGMTAGGPLLFWMGRSRTNSIVFVHCPVSSPCLMH